MIRTTLARRSTWVFRSWSVAALLVMAGCDAGKEPWQQGEALEKGGKPIEAAERFDAVCARAPKSKLCAPSQMRAAEARIAAAGSLMKAFEYEKASQALDTVLAAPATEAHKRAKDLRESLELRMGLRWEAGMKSPDKRATYDAMSEVVSSGTPVAPKAEAWLKEHALPFDLAILKERCAKPAQPMCLEQANGLLKRSPGTPEAAEAQKLRDTYLASEKERITGVLAQLEPELADCARLWKQDKVFQQWSPFKLAAEQFVAHPGAFVPRPTVPRCKDDGTHDTCNKALEQERAILKRVQQIGYTNIAKPHYARRATACYAGKYEKQTPSPPEERDMGVFPHSVE